jgi:hypothetical protein
MNEKLVLEETNVDGLKHILIEDKELHKMINWWSCDACGGDSEDGCQMSDPEDCVRR